LVAASRTSSPTFPGAYTSAEVTVNRTCAAPRLGINSITGEGLGEAMEGTSLVIDVSNSPNFEYQTALEFFPDLDPQPAGRRGGGRRAAPRRPVGRRHGDAGRQR
jgi:hypothetical protein